MMRAHQVHVAVAVDVRPRNDLGVLFGLREAVAAVAVRVPQGVEQQVWCERAARASLHRHAQARVRPRLAHAWNREV